MLLSSTFRNVTHEVSWSIKRDRTFSSVDFAVDLGSDGAFQINTNVSVEAKQQRSPASFVGRRLRKIVQRVKLFHNLIRNAPHPDEAFLFIQPSNQSGLHVTTPRSPDSPGRLHICRGFTFHSHSPGRIPGGGVSPIG